MLTGANLGIYYCWQTWNWRKAHLNFNFSETTFWNLGYYQTLFLCPLSFENNFFFYANLPGLIYSGLLIERHLGPAVLLGAYLTNCLVSAGTTTAVHRQIGYHRVLQRGRMANDNGNITLFLTTLFSVAAPNYAIYKGGSFATSFFFYYLLAFYGLLFFTQHLTLSPT